MSQLIAKITQIQNVDSLHKLILKFNKYELEVISLELTDDIAINTIVALSIKPSSVMLSKIFHNDISCQNQLQATIISIDKGELLSSLILDIEGVKIESIVAKTYIEDMKFKTKDKIVILIKSSDISIEEVIE